MTKAKPDEASTRVTARTDAQREALSDFPRTAVDPRFSSAGTKDPVRDPSAVGSNDVPPRPRNQPVPEPVPPEQGSSGGQFLAEHIDNAALQPGVKALPIPIIPTQKEYD